MQGCTRDALACLKMQLVSPWQLEMLPSPGPTGSSPHHHPILRFTRGGVQSITSHPTQPPPSPEPHLTQPPGSAAFFSHRNHRLRADCSKILPMDKRGRDRHSSQQSIVSSLTMIGGAQPGGLMGDHLLVRRRHQVGAEPVQGGWHQRTPRLQTYLAGSPQVPCPG